MSPTTRKRLFGRVSAAMISAAVAHWRRRSSFARSCSATGSGVLKGTKWLFRWLLKSVKRRSRRLRLRIST
jgi:hypothetical protein